MDHADRPRLTGQSPSGPLAIEGPLDDWREVRARIHAAVCVQGATAEQRRAGGDFHVIT